VTRSDSLAAAIRAGRADALARVAAQPLRVCPDNLVERPWGGHRLPAYKGLADPALAGRRFGEAFEVCADPCDPEARAHPSRIALPDGSEIGLPELLEAAPEPLLGAALARTSGARLPLLPKTLDVCELLSVQAHPPGQPELYLVLEADPGATLRVGFRGDVDARALAARLAGGRAAQEALLGLLRPEADLAALQGALATAFARGGAGGPEALCARIEPQLAARADRRRAAALLGELCDLYGEVLAQLNEIPVQAGQLIFNASRPGDAPNLHSSVSADVHALGNPEGRELLILEVRRPGPTLRAWDHVRFPLRELAIEPALRSVSRRGRDPDEYRVEPRPVPGCPGLLRSVECAFFGVDHLRPGRAPVAQSSDGGPRTLHAIRGSLEIRAPGGAVRLRRGESALLPAALGAYEVAAHDGAAGCEAVQVRIPAGA
jgi:hypothetical protein